MNKEEMKSQHAFYSEQLIKYQNEEPQAAQRVITAEANLMKARLELAEAKDHLAGIRGGIKIFVSELRFLEEKIEQ